MTRPAQKALFIATTNQGKLREIDRRLTPLGMTVIPIDRPFIEVQADTLEEVVRFGMERLASEGLSDMMFMKDDSGLFVEALGGFPGVYSAYVNRTLSCRGLLRLMEGIADRKAVFRTVMGLNEPGKGIRLFDGECRGSISDQEVGTNGFGFDPIFVPEGDDRTFAQMTTEEKNASSHRIMALDRLVQHLYSS